MFLDRYGLDLSDYSRCGRADVGLVYNRSMAERIERVMDARLRDLEEQR
jgi:hypothetical protein